MIKKSKEKIRVDFYEFAYIWFRIQSLKIAKHQIEMAKWLEKIFYRNDKKALLMAFRNSGKSTIVGLFCAWILYSRNEARILVIAADYALAKKMVKNVKNIIERHLLTKNLKPQKLEEWASDQFTVSRDVELRDPSMLAKGLGANITGLRADIIICDDVEVPKNCDTIYKRGEMREKLSELDYILSPDGMQIYVGTPHTYNTIYKNELDESELESEPFLLGFDKLHIPILDERGCSNWPQRFPVEKIASIRSRSGENKFLSQMMLQPVMLTDSVLNPNRLVSYDYDLEESYSNQKEILKLGGKKLVSASAWWDPSFACGDKSDDSVVACVFSDEEGRYYLHDIEYIKIEEKFRDEVASKQCEKVVEFIIRNFLPSIRVEVNGIGKFLPSILKKTLKKKGVRSAVLEAYSSKNKEMRILEAFETLLADRALKVHKKIWETSFIEEMREWSFEGRCKDDALDAVSGCLLSEPIRFFGMGNYTENTKIYNWQGVSGKYEAKTDFEV